MQEGREDRSTPVTQRIAGLTGSLILGLVVVAPAAASWHGLTGWGRAHGAEGAWAYLVPLVVDGAAAYAAWLALRDVLRGRSAIVDRLLVWMYAAGSAALNAAHADATGGLGAAAFFAGASASAALLWDRTLRHARWDQLAALGVIEPPLPRFRALRWVLAPRETFGAWRLAVREGASQPHEALALYRSSREGKPKPAPSPTPAAVMAQPQPRAVASEARKALAAGEKEPPRSPDEQSTSPPPSPQLAGLSKADALQTVWAALDVAPTRDQVLPALVWLADRGVEVNKSYAYQLVRRMEDQAAESRRAALTVARGGR